MTTHNATSGVQCTPMDAQALEELRRWRVVPERLAHWATHRPNDRFVRCGGDWLTFADAHNLSRAVAAGLHARGIGRGDRVAVIMPNREEYVLAILGLAHLGAVQVPLNVYLRGTFLRYQLADSQARALIADAAGIAEAQAQRDTLPELTTIIGVGPDIPPHCVPWSALLEHDSPPERSDVEAADLLSIMYTSGTTGMPKGCMLSHGYYTSIGWSWYGNDWCRPTDRMLSAMPLFHVGGQGGALINALMGGMSLEVLPAFSASTILARARETGASVLYGVGAMALAMMATEPRADDRDHELRTTIFPAGPPIPPAVQQAWRDRFGVEIICEGYGQSECVPMAMSPSGAQRGTQACLGVPVPQLEVAILDEHNRRVSVGEPGEIAVRPREPLVMFDGYWGKPEATAHTWRGLWHHTGDTARLEADGTLTFLDRRTDSMRRRGENISAIEVEAALLTHPDITAAAVHGVPSEFGDDDVKAWIVPVEAAHLDPAELHAWLTRTLPYFAVPRYVQSTTELPVNALGRVQKFVLKERGNHSAWDFDALGFTVDRSTRRDRTPDSDEAMTP